jgi:hypothetical protein
METLDKSVIALRIILSPEWICPRSPAVFMAASLFSLRKNGSVPSRGISEASAIKLVREMGATGSPTKRNHGE